jgi:hypothetical protein
MNSLSNKQSKKNENDCLIIFCNTSDIAYFKEYLHRKNSEFDPIFIASQDDFDQFVISPHFSKTPAIFCLISVEPRWNSDLIFGYELARKLMESKIANNNILHLHFYSFRTQKQLYDENKSNPRYRGLIKSFPHYQLPFNADMVFNWLKFSHEKWEYLRKYIMTTGGFLDSIIHDLNGLNSKPNSNENQFLDIKDRILDNPTVFGQEIVSLVKESNRFSEIAQQLSSKIDVLRKTITNDAPQTDKNNSEKQLLNKPKLIILEDNKDDLDWIKTFFQDDFEIPDNGQFRDGTDALRYLETENSFVDVLICDLELLNQDGLDLPVQGIDVVLEVKSKYPHIALRVITNTPKKGINYLVGNSILAKEIINKSSLYGNDVNFKSSLIESLKGDVLTKQKLTNLRGPENTYWTSGEGRQTNSNPGHLKRYFYHLKHNEPNTFKIFWANIEKCITDVDSGIKISTEFGSVKHYSSIAFPDNTKEKTHHDFFKNILVNRLFWISKVYHPQNKNIAFKPDSYSRLFSDAGKKFTKNYFSILGFGIKDLTSSPKISFGEFLDDEREWYKNFQESLNKKSEKKEGTFDYLNSELKGNTVEILKEIGKANARYFTKAQYPDIARFEKDIQNNPTSYATIKNLFDQIQKEKQLKDLNKLDQPESRDKIVEIIEKIMNNNSEFVKYDESLKEAIIKAYDNIYHER